MNTVDLNRKAVDINGKCTVENDPLLTDCTYRFCIDRK